jgi:thiamine kinase-like enzyme
MAAETVFDAASADPEEANKAAIYASLDVPRLGRELAWMKTVLPSPANGDGQALLQALAAETGAPAAAEGSPSVAAAHTSLTVPRLADAAAQARVDAAALIFRVVYAHNDLLSGNVLHLESPLAGEGEDAATSPREHVGGAGAGSSGGDGGATPSPAAAYINDRVQIIDYEYGGYNYCGFDVANHFCEHAGFDFDLDRWYPGPPTQQRWLRAYLDRAGIRLPTAGTYSGASGGGEEEDAVTAAFLEEMVRRVNEFALASHAWWGLWAIVQARHSPIPFDFIAYSRDRFRGYDKHKAAFFPAAPLHA